MAAIAAHVGSLSIAGEPAEFLESEAVPMPAPDFTGTEFRIADPELRRLNPGAPVFVEVSPSGDADAWTPVDAYVDPLFGDVQLASAPGPSALVRVSGYALPVHPLALVRSISLTVTNDVVELQVMGDAYKRRSVSLRDFSGELTGLALTELEVEALAEGTPLLIEVGKASGAQVFRAWVKVPELSHKLTPGALYEHTMKFLGFAFQSEDGAVFAWGYGSP